MVAFPVTLAHEGSKNVTEITDDGAAASAAWNDDKLVGGREVVSSRGGRPLSPPPVPPVPEAADAAAVRS